jgi:putative polyhydroxyalkanoate system protein
MADIEIRREHALGLEGAREAADRMAEHLGRRFDLRGGWEGNQFRFERPGVAGLLEVTAKDLHLSVSLGFLLKALRGSLERAIHEELDGLFAAGASPKKDPSPRKKGG